MASRKDIQADVVEQVTAPTPVTEDADKLDFDVVARKGNQTLLQKDHARKALAEVYRREPKKSVMVAPMYAPYFGKVMHIMINGISSQYRATADLMTSLQLLQVKSSVELMLSTTSRVKQSVTQMLTLTLRVLLENWLCSKSMGGQHSPPYYFYKQR